jgi:hypothetical protein
MELEALVAKIVPKDSTMVSRKRTIALNVTEEDIMKYESSQRVKDVELASTVLRKVWI